MEKSIFDKNYRKTKWGVARFANAEDAKIGKIYAEEESQALFGCSQKTHVDGNILVNSGINEMWLLVCGGTATAYDNANAYLAVGTSTTAEAATQTTLVAESARVGMDVTYPTSGTSQKATWRATFDGATANVSWQEFAVLNVSTGGDMMNRKVSDQGTKTSGQVWQLTLEITLS
jgi:hypothetical protein